MNLNRFQGFLKSLDMNRTKDNYEELIKLKNLQVKFFNKQKIIMEISERIIYLLHNCEKEIEELNNIKCEDLSQRYMIIYYYNQDLIRSFVTNFETALEEYRLMSNKIDLVFKDALTLFFNCVLSENEYLLTKSILNKIKNRFQNQLAKLEEGYTSFKCFLNDKIEFNDMNNNHDK